MPVLWTHPWALDGDASFSALPSISIDRRFEAKRPWFFKRSMRSVDFSRGFRIGAFSRTGAQRVARVIRRDMT